VGRLDNLGYTELLAEAEEYLRVYSADGGPSEPQGGQFALGGGRVGAKAKKAAPKRHPAKPAGHAPARRYPPIGAGMLGFDGSQGTGYGHKGGDPKVHTLQKALNALGLTDDQGKPLTADGKYGPKTTAAVKKLQKKLGLDPTGQVTPQLIEQVARVAKRRPRRQRSAYGSAVVTDDEHAWLHQRAVDILDLYGIDDRVD